MRWMATMTKGETVTLRLTRPEKSDLDRMAVLCGKPAGTLASSYVREGVRRTRFPAVDFRDGTPGRVAYLTGTRWPVWMIVELVDEHGGKPDKAVELVRRPLPLLRQALAYAAAYPEEIAASRELHTQRDFAAIQAVMPDLEQL